MRTPRRAAARWLPLVACVGALALPLAGCASGDAGGGILGDGGAEGATSWPASVPRPDLPLVEETDLVIAVTATYALRGEGVDGYVAELEAAGFAPGGASTYVDGDHVVLVETEGDRLFVTITEA